MKTEGLTAKGRIGDRGHHHDWLSRDYLDIDCKATVCKFNIHEKCAAPSLCKITPDGRCEGFQARPMPKVEGD